MPARKKRKPPKPKAARPKDLTPRTPREREFARLVGPGRLEKSDAYLKAGYTWNGTPEGLWTKACKLAKRPRVAAEIARLNAEVDAAAVKDAAVTREMITQNLLEDRRRADELDRPSAMVTADMGLAKLHGLLVDRHKVTVTHEDALAALDEDDDEGDTE